MKSLGAFSGAGWVACSYDGMTSLVLSAGRGTVGSDIVSSDRFHYLRS